MRKAVLIIVLLLIGFYFGFKSTVDEFVRQNIIYKTIRYEANEYYRTLEPIFFNEYDGLVVYNKDDILNLFYTFINKGTADFNFYCDSNYVDCSSDISSLMKDKLGFLYVNDFVHPYNSFDSINVTVNNNNVHLQVEKLYSASEIKEVDSYIEKIVNELITDKMTDREKVKVIHDYLILNTDYDAVFAKEILNNIKSDKRGNKATGVFLDKTAVCSGYTDAMALFLDYLNIKNFKISTDMHVWNIVNIDGSWLHLDVTSDDMGDEIINRCFLVDSKKIRDDKNHEYSKVIFSGF